MKRHKLYFIISSIIVVNCIGPGTTVNMSNNYDLSEFTQIEWAITKSDSIIDFRKSMNGYAIIEGNKIIETVQKDSIRIYEIGKFKTLYANDGPDTLLYLVIGVSVFSLIIYVYFFVPRSIG